MGVLEDAIREHLELKRAHGASDEELEREETEALGSARRQEPADEADAPVDEEALPEDEPFAEEAPSAEAPPAEDPLPYDDEALHAEDAAPEAPLDFGEPPELGADEGFASGELPEEDLSAGRGSFVDDELEGDDLAPEPAVPPDFATEFEDPPEAEPPLAEPPPPESHHEAIAFDEDEPGVAPPMPEPAQPEPAGTEGPEGEAEDVLEDTPDFLQDTPDHDRLWFEQKPPRDFDFD
jgi:hypothetical protein